MELVQGRDVECRSIARVESGFIIVSAATGTALMRFVLRHGPTLHGPGDR